MSTLIIRLSLHKHAKTCRKPKFYRREPHAVLVTEDRMRMAMRIGKEAADTDGVSLMGMVASILVNSFKYSKLIRKHSTFILKPV